MSLSSARRGDETGGPLCGGIAASDESAPKGVAQRLKPRSGRQFNFAMRRSTAPFFVKAKEGQKVRCFA